MQQASAARAAGYPEPKFVFFEAQLQEMDWARRVDVRRC